MIIQVDVLETRSNWGGLFVTRTIREKLETAYKRWTRHPGNLYQDRACFLRECSVVVALIVGG